MFRGRHDHTIDKKGRLSIPAAYRTEFQRRSDKPPILTTFKDHLALYPSEDWEVIEQDLLTKPEMNEEVMDLSRFMSTGAAECPIDSQGRILVPPPYREHAMLSKNVTVAGVLKRVEIWDTDLFEAKIQATRTNLSTIQEKVQEMSVN